MLNKYLWTHLKRISKIVIKSLSSLAWDAALKIAQVQLELLNDSDMLLMIENGIRGEIATISHRHAKINNAYMRAEFDPTKDFKFIHI